MRNNHSTTAGRTVPRRHTSWALHLLVALMSFTLTMFGLQQANAWSSISAAIPGTSGSAFWPDVAVSPDGVVHALWEDLNADGLLVYARGVMNGTGTGVAWDSFQRFTSTGSRDNTGRIAVDATGRVHIIFISDDYRGVYYTNSNGGAAGYWSSENFPLNDNGDIWTPGLAVDDTGVVYVAWGSGIDGSRVMLTSRGTNNVWNSPINVSGADVYLTRNVEMGVVGSGAGAIVHVVYESKGKSTADFKTGYSRGTTAGFAAMYLSDAVGYSGLNADLPIIGTDKTDNGHLMVGFTYGDPKNLGAGFNKLFVTSLDNGITWVNPTPMSLGGGRWYGRGDMDANNGVAHIVSEQKYWDGSQVSTIKAHYQSCTFSNNGFSGGVEIGGLNKSTQPRISVGGPGKAAVFTKGNTDNIYHNVDPGGGGGSTAPTATPAAPTATPTPGGGGTDPTATPTPTTPPDNGTPGGTLNINNGKLVTQNDIDSVPVVLTLTQGQADQYKLWGSGDDEPTSFSSMDVLEAPTSWIASNAWDVLPTSTEPERYPCETQWVYMRLKDTSSGNTSDRVEGSFEVDPGVDALVRVENPGPGDPQYTGGPYYVFVVEDRGGECSGIRKVEMWETGATSQTLTLNNYNLAADDPPGVMPLISATTGDHTIMVRLTDGVDNVQSYERVITLDTQAPAVSAAAGALQAVTNNTTTAIEVTDTSEVGLRFSDVTVTDDMYGTKSGEDYPFWGICAVNSLNDTAITTSELLETCTDRAVTTATENGGAYTFSVNKWNLVEGLDPLPDGGTTVYVSACVMDGANCGDQLFTTAVQLAEGYTVPQPQQTPTPTEQPSTGLEVYLPMIMR